jgi:hypothetical protein
VRIKNQCASKTCSARYCHAIAPIGKCARDVADAEHAVLHQVIAEHLEAFLRAVAAAGDGAGLPQFVEREFREFLTCGVFEHGVARFQCEGCAREHWCRFRVKGGRGVPVAVVAA